MSFTLAGTATGGDTIQDIGGYRIHTFTTVGTSTFTPSRPCNVEVLVVAGGGGSGGGLGGAGGAGGVIYTRFTVSNAVTVTIGGGGGGGSDVNTAGSNGGISIFSSLTAIGGGGGGADVGSLNGKNGGSGGGGGSQAGTFGTAGTGTAGQGNNGGTASETGPGFGGGGGAGAVGGNGSGSNGGNGGNGLSYSISGSSVYYGGGGGGGVLSGTRGTGGLGGGANGVLSGGGQNGTNGTGGGAGGGTSGAGGTGGTGIVIVRYLIQSLISSSGKILVKGGSATILYDGAPTSNTALSLPGTSGNVMNLGTFFPSRADPSTSNIFVEAWIYLPTGATGFPFTVSDSGSEDMGLLVNYGSTTQFRIWDTAGNGINSTNTGALSSATWYHIAGSWDRTNNKVYGFVNGTVGSGIGDMTGRTARSRSTSSLVIGAGNAGTFFPFNGYIRDFRMVKGGIVPTTTFTPAGAPFSLNIPSYVTGGSTALSLATQYMQKTTLIGTPLFSQLSASATSSVVGAFSLRAVNGTTAKAVNVRTQAQDQFPSSAMTSAAVVSGGGLIFTQTLSGGYSAGQYVASCSRYDYGWTPIGAFDLTNSSSIWQVRTSAYTTGTYTGATTTAGYGGEWIELQVPSLVKITSYYIKSEWTSDFVLLGSTDASAWTLIDTQTGLINGQTKTITGLNPSYYSYYRFVIRKSYTNVSYPGFNNIILYGSSASWTTDQAQAQFPPSAMTQTGTNSSTQTLGTGGNFQGSYTASSSTSAFGWGASGAFGLTNSGSPYIWQVGNYPGGGGTVSTPTTTTTGATNYNGEWLQFQTPFPINLTGYSAGTSFLTSVVLLASTTGATSSWTLVDSNSAITVGSTITNTGLNFAGYSYFRFVVITSTTNYPSLYNVKFFGTVPSPNLAQDFYADRLGNLLTAPVVGQSLANWLGGATGYVTTWYDQSGRGNDATQATAANQPTINLSNVSVVFSGAQRLSNANVNGGFIPYGTSNYSVVTKHVNFTAGSLWMAGSNNGGLNGLRWATGNNYENFQGGGFLNFGPQPGTYPVVVSVVNNRTTNGNIGYVNGVQKAAATQTPNVPVVNQYIGFDNNAGSYMIGELNSVIFFSSDISSSDRLIVESLI